MLYASMGFRSFLRFSCFYWNRKYLTFWDLKIFLGDLSNGFFFRVGKFLGGECILEIVLKMKTSHTFILLSMNCSLLKNTVKLLLKNEVIGNMEIQIFRSFWFKEISVFEN